MIDEVTPLMFCNYTSGTDLESARGKKGSELIDIVELIQ